RRAVGRLVRRRGNPRVDEAGGAIEQALDRVGLHDHLTELVLDRAEAGDRLPELTAGRGVFGALRDRADRAAAAHRTQLEAGEVQDVERDLVAFADLAEQVLGRP